ncbi:MAG: hypothetical protein V7724_05445 [Sediminicola sp.]
MTKKTFLALPLLVFLSCGGVKKTQEALNVGDYEQAMSKAMDNLADNKTKKGNQPYIILLEQAFKKNTERELQEISFLQKEGNPANLERMYTGYLSLKNIQERIRPLLPLYIQEEGRNAKFDFKDYDNPIIQVKRDLSEHLFVNANGILQNASNKLDYRKAYDDFAYLEELSPGYPQAKEKMEQAYQKGLDYVKVLMFNDSEQIIPVRLEEELLNFNTYGLNDLWTQYHANALDNVPYDYEMQLAFKNIHISPEQITEKQISREKQIKDGYTYAQDSKGNILKDSLGNKIKVDKFKTIRCNFYQFTQFKSVQVTGNVLFIDLKTKQPLNTYPISSEYIFQHIHANYKGDKRALDTDLIGFLDNVAVPFPSNEQMVLDAGNDLKSKLKGILANQRYR